MEITSAPWTWTNPDDGTTHTIQVRTVKLETETPAEWKRRHLADVALAKEQFPPDAD